MLAEATEAANGQDVRIGGGVRTARDYLRAGLVDHLHIMIAPSCSAEATVCGTTCPRWSSHTVTTEVAEGGTTHVTFSR